MLIRNASSLPASRYATHFIFAQRYRRPRGNCVQSELLPPSVSFFAPFTFSLLCYPFRPSTLIIYRGYAADGGICTTRNRKKKKVERTSTRISGFAILSFCFDHSVSPHSEHFANNRARETMRWRDRTTGCKGSARISAANNTLIFARYSNSFRQERGWKSNERVERSDAERERENCTKRMEKINE